MITHCTFPHVHLFWLAMVDYCLMFLRYLLQYWSSCELAEPSPINQRWCHHIENWWLWVCQV